MVYCSITGGTPVIRTSPDTATALIETMFLIDHLVQQISETHKNPTKLAVIDIERAIKNIYGDDHRAKQADRSLLYLARELAKELDLDLSKVNPILRKLEEIG